MLILRALQGISLAALPAVSYAYIGEEFTGRAVGLAIGLYISSNSIGGMGGRVISGIVADIWGWRYSFLIMGLFGLACYLLFIILLPASRHFAPRQFSFPRAGREIKSHLKNKDLRQAYYIAGILFFIFIGLFNYLSYYLHAAPYHLSMCMIGLLYLSYLAGTLSSTISGRLAGVLTIRLRVIFGLTCMVAGILLMLTVPLFLILLGLVILCFGFFFAHAAASNWVSQRARRARGSASALYLFAYYAGGSLGSTCLGFVWEPWGWQAVAWSCIALLLAGMATALRMEGEKH